MKPKYHCVYKITNNVNRNFYIGIHSTDNLNDSYMGSGKLIKIAMRNYGKHKFSKEILHVFGTRKEALDKERELVDHLIVKKRACYNLCVGGGDKPTRKQGKGITRMVLCLQTGIYYEKLKDAAIAKNVKYEILLARINNNYMKPTDIIDVDERRFHGYRSSKFIDD